MVMMIDDDDDVQPPTPTGLNPYWASSISLANHW